MVPATVGRKTKMNVNLENIENRPQGFKELLQTEHFRRMKINPRYSLRAFAKYLNTDFSTLGKMMRGQRPIGKSTILKLGTRLGIPPQQLENYVNLTQVEKRSRLDSGKQYTQLSEDCFQVISDPVHYAILELIRVCGFKGDLGWISRALGLTLAELDPCVERLQRIGLLEISADGVWQEKSSDGRLSVLDFDYTTAARKSFQKMVFARAVQAIEDVDFNERSHSSMTFAIDSRRLPAAKRQIARFERELAKFLSRGKQRDRVYQMGVCLYPLSVNQEKSK